MYQAKNPLTDPENEARVAALAAAIKEEEQSEHDGELNIPARHQAVDPDYIPLPAGSYTDRVSMLSLGNAFRTHVIWILLVGIDLILVLSAVLGTAVFTSSGHALCGGQKACEDAAGNLTSLAAGLGWLAVLLTVFLLGAAVFFSRKRRNRRKDRPLLADAVKPMM